MVYYKHLNIFVYIKDAESIYSMNEHTITSGNLHYSVMLNAVVLSLKDRKLQVLLSMDNHNQSSALWGLPDCILPSTGWLDEYVRYMLKERYNIAPTYLHEYGIHRGYTGATKENTLQVLYLVLTRVPEFQFEYKTSHARWFSVNNLPDISKETEIQLQRALDALSERIFFEPVAFDLLPEYFTMGQLQHLYESILGLVFDRRNFSKKMNHLGVLVPKKMEEKFADGRSRVLYTLNADKYREFKACKLKLEF